MEHEPNNSDFSIETSDQVPPGFYFMSDGEKVFFGSITDLGDNFLGSGLFRLFVEKGRKATIMINKGDWERSPDLIFKLDQ
jgi:hypothetical protein